MASRYVQTKAFDYCYNPIHIVDNDKNVVVPCGKCDGCRLHKANEWSMRLGDEIDNCPYPVFSTLTYSNRYLPKLRYLPILEMADGIYPFKYHYQWISNHKDNIRVTLNAKLEAKEVLRKDDLLIDYPYDSIVVQKFNDYPCIAYSSKRDFQLYLKLVRQLINYEFPQKEDSLKRFRYFAISEYGPTTYRPHIHFIIFFKDREVSEYFINRLVYACWPMCDKSRIADYTHYCTSGARGYLTQYLTCFSGLPKVYTENKELRPFRLASKANAVGFNSFSKTEVSELYAQSTDQYVKQVSRLGARYLFRIPSGYTSSIFPKCREYRKLSFYGLRGLYGLLFDLSQDYTECRRCRSCTFESKFDCVSLRLRALLCPQDYNSTLKCYRYCMEFGCTPEHYLYLLDMVYYKKDMFALKLFYEYQQKLAENQKWLSIARLYNNFMDIKNWFLNGSDYDIYVGRLFLSSVNIDVADYDTYDSYQLSQSSLEMDSYKREVSDILKDMVKTAKFNELVGLSPTSV